MIFLAIFATSVSVTLTFSSHHIKIFFLLYYKFKNLKFYFIFYFKKKRKIGGLGGGSRPPLGPGVSVEGILPNE
jgi:hypothetical protein